MATKLPTTFFLGNGWRGLNCNSNPNVQLSLPSRHSLQTSYKIRHRNSRFQQKKQQEKNVSPEPLPISERFQQSDDESAEIKMAPVDIISHSDLEMSPNSDESTEVQNDKEDSIPSLNKESTSNNEADITFTDQNNSLGYLDSSTSSREADITFTDQNNSLGYLDSSTSSREQNEPSQTETAYTAEKLSNIQLEDLVGMIRNAEKNVLLLNQARVRALEDLDQIVTEKEALQGEINTLEMRLAETDARIQVAAQEKIHMKLLEDQLENLKNELSERGDFVGNNHVIHENNKENLDTGATVSHETRFYSLSVELRSIRKENITLKDDILELKKELSNFKGADERLLAVENERSTLDATLKDLESRFAAAQKDVLKISTLEFECKDLRDKIGYLQGLLDKTTKQADRAIAVLQQNHELQKKVDRLEESLQEAELYRLSSEKMQQYNELMQQKMQILQESLDKSDQEIQSHIQLYQESVLEFQDIVGSLKEDSKSKPSYEPVEDLPWVFWSRLLLIVDGWLLENKISSNDAKLLREMAWKRDRRICEAYLACKDKNESEVVATFMKLIPSSPTSLGLHIIHIAAEMAPVAKVGGLGDVVSGLSKALQKKGHLVEVVLPKYDCIQCDRVGDMRALDMVLESFFDGQLYKNKVWIGTVEGLPVYFIEPLHPSNFFSRGQFYGEHDDFKRFSYFSRAALELLLQSGKKPDIIHCHDWQTAFVAPLYWDLYAPKGLNSARVVFTCHNFEYQGTANASELASCGLDVHRLNRPDRMQDHSARDRINPVKGAVVYSNIVTTVSPTYAQEVRTSQGGHGLHATLNSQSKKFIGILNGIDTDAWDPSTDMFLKVQYNVDDLQGKAENKEALRKHLGLSSSNVRQPLVGCITRLVPQKGVHLIRHAIYRMLELGGQFVLLGSSPVPHIQREFEEIADHFKDHPNVRLILKYDEALSHSIYAASDMFIIPSIFEPCGLTQMIAMRYGSVPIVRKTGGLNDSVFDLDDDTVPLEFRNGFTFLHPDEQGVNSALDRAFKLYMKNNESWQQLVEQIMKIDFTWDASAAQYVKLYEMSVGKARAATRL